VLTYYSFNFGLRIWDVELSTGNPLMDILICCKAWGGGWVMSQDDEPLFRVPLERKHLYVPPFKVVIEESQISTIEIQGSAKSGQNTSTKSSWEN